MLVTGATGFIGGHVVRALLDQGRAVRALGRNVDRGLELMRLGADFRPVDLRNRAATFTACEGVVAVVHAGAKTSAWGRARDFLAVNARGTAHVVDACLQQSVQRLVYLSTASVSSRPVDRRDLTESE